MRPPRISLLQIRSFHPSPARLSSDPPPSQWDRISPVQLAFDLHKEGQCKRDSSKCKNPIVFLHGLFGSKQNNRSITDSNRPVYAIDLRNHGSSPHAQPHTYAALAADVSAFLSTHNLSKPTLIGHSMGAKTAMALALWQPDRIANLIAVDNAPVDASLKSDFHSYVVGMREVAKHRCTKQSEANEVLKPYAKELAVRQFLLQNLVRPRQPAESSHLVWRIPVEDLAKPLDAMGDFPFRNPDEARYQGPTLIVRGTKSPYVADEALPIIGRFFPKFRLVDVEAGHWLTSENPEAFRRAVVEFLEDQE